MRFLLVCALLAAAGAGVVFWREPPGPPDEIAYGPGPARPSSPVARFSLTKEDATLDRERPSVAASLDGTVLVACNSRAGTDSNAILVCVSRDRGATFSAPRPIRSVPVHRHMARMGGQDRLMESQPLPRLAWAAGKFHLAWCEPAEAGGGRLMACSTTDGESFSESVALHGPEVRKVHYTALCAGGDGRLLAAWLDNRGQGQQPFASTGGVSALVDAGTGGKGICPCCDLDTLITSSGDEVVAYRHSVDGNRDIHLAWRPRGEETFRKGGPVSGRHWKFQACPHDGPSIAEAGGQVVAAWMDAAEQKRRAFTATGTMSTLPWHAEPLPLLRGGEQSQPRLAATGETVAAVWLESFVENEARGTLVAASFRHPGAKGWTEPMVVSTDPTGVPTRPSVCLEPLGGLVVAWFEQQPEGRSLVVARVKTPAGGCCRGD